MKRFALVLTVLLTVLFASVAQAQTGDCPTSTAFVVNGTRVCFKPNVADHNAVDSVSGVALVTRYDVLFFAEAADVATATPIQTSSVSKPTLNAQNAAWATLPSYPVGQRLKAAVVAVGPGGTSARGTASNPFGQSAPPTVPRASSSVTVVPE